MAKKSGVVSPSGNFKNLKTEETFTDVGEVMDEVAKNRCFGPDACNGDGGVFYWIDQVSGAKYVQYSKNGSLLYVTEAVYLADKAAGFV